jgi:hypothetical protein
MKIKNWHKFQHYHNRRPPWIKFYAENIEELKADGSDNDFWTLDDSEKLALMLAWLLASHFNGELPDKPSDWFKKRLGIKSFPLKSLIEKGFIESASKVASIPASDVLAPENREREQRERDSMSTPQAGQKYTEGFLAFWKQYPKKKGQPVAFKAWQKGIKSEPLILEKCIKALAWQKSSDDWTRDNGQFIPNPATYLNQARWNDEPFDPEQAAKDARKAHDDEIRAQLRKEGLPI